MSERALRVNLDVQPPSMHDLSQTSARSPLVECPRGPLVIPTHAPGVSASAPRLSVVVPTFNERRNVPELVAQLTATLGQLLGRQHEIIIVDDDSPDRTWELAAELGAKYPTLRVVRRQGERGLSTAVIRGWQVASGDVLGVIDGDMQHPPGAFSKLWAAIEQGADLAVGSRNVHGGGVSDWSAARRMLSRGAQACGLLLLPGVLGRLRDPMSGYFVVRRSAICGVQLDPLGYKILVEVVGRGRITSIEEVGYVFRERAEGNSKVSWRIYVDYLRHLVRLRRARR